MAIEIPDQFLEESPAKTVAGGSKSIQRKSVEAEYINDMSSLRSKFLKKSLPTDVNPRKNGSGKKPPKGGKTVMQTGVVEFIKENYVWIGIAIIIGFLILR